MRHTVDMTHYDRNRGLIGSQRQDPMPERNAEREMDKTMKRSDAILMDIVPPRSLRWAEGT